jgi:hypothetical protein
VAGGIAAAVVDGGAVVVVVVDVVVDVSVEDVVVVAGRGAADLPSDVARTTATPAAASTRATTRARTTRGGGTRIAGHGTGEVRSYVRGKEKITSVPYAKSTPLRV